MLCTAPDRLERIGQVTGQPTPAGADKCAKVVHGAALFLSDVLAHDVHAPELAVRSRSELERLHLCVRVQQCERA